MATGPAPHREKTMIVRCDPAHRLVGALAIVAFVAACSSSGPGSAWTAAPVPATSSPPLATPAAASPAATAPATPPAATPPAPTPGPTLAAGITDAEFSTLTGGTGQRGLTFDPPPPVTREQAETLIREQFPGDRPLIWSSLVAFGDPEQHGWMVVLGTAPGQRCDLHAGLLERALEGGIVDATEGDLEWTYRCG